MWRNVIDLVAARRKTAAVFLGLLLSVLVFGLHACSNGRTGEAIPFKNGVVDLTAYDLARSEPVRLDGFWQFWWGKLLEPGSEVLTAASDAAEYRPVPQFWTSYRGHDYPAKGYGTYRLRLKTSGKCRELALRTPEIFSEYRLWINSRLVAQNGMAPTDNIRFLKPDVFAFATAGPEIEIVLQVQNRLHGHAGIGQSFFFGAESRVYRNYIISLAMEIMLISICFFAGFYHLILFVSRRMEKELLYFGLFCFMLALRTIFTGNTLISCIIPDLPFVLGSKIATSTIPLCVVLFNIFFYYFFREILSQKLFKVLILIHFFYLTLVVVLPSMIYSTLFCYYLSLVAINLLFVIWANIKGIIHRIPYAALFLSGLSILALGTANDILHYLQVLNTGYYLALFFQVFILAQSVMLAVKFSREHRLVAQLTDRLQVLDKLKDEFLANTSHELRTPLNGIIGIAGSLVAGVSGALPDSAKENLELIISSGRRLSTLISDILDFSKLKNNDIEVSKSWVDIRQMISVVMTVIKTTTTGHQVRLINAVQEDAPLVAADENRLQQILYNLIGNSVKYTENGQVRVFCTTGNDTMTVHVEDTGPGIPPEKLEAIFRPFEQGDGSLQRGHTGTGLGLPITKKLVELHGGCLQVTSEPGRGSCFSFALPGIKERGAAGEDRKQGAKAPEIFISDPKGEPPRQKTSAAPHRRILIVDDEAVNVRVLLNYLALKGYGADAVANGYEALKKIDAEDYDLVLLDIMMPRLSGYDVCRVVRKRYSPFELPIIFLTAKNQAQDIATAFEVGGNDYLAKPVDRTELLARIDTHLALKIAVRNAIRNAKLANVDPLTELYNRRFLVDMGQRELKRANRDKTDMTVIMLDIDYFKEINDTFGHDAGDHLLKWVSTIIKNNIRGSDLPARFGGDEFVVILPGTDLRGGAHVAEKIRSVAEQSVVRAADGKELRFTLSLGVAVSCGEHRSFDDVMRRADERLYESKKNGRNRLTA
ncbi:MAG: diguanylate cyclase [Deltaproteobacteria bacterium]|nr:diguanylate cyclase [Deltaproteobacteria bacterium]